ncbi:MAG: DNA polymerase III subunit gamma/tau [Eubacteriales bacterium]|nr:DNA polymerase III subunit gamma/tau [Eubacteriales bacterium]
MSYQALYRKWRPLDFKEVKGQDHIVTTLQNQIKADRIGHAYLFCGTRGTGKTTVAKILAKAVNCENPQDGNPCGECPSCRAIAAGTSMNVIEIDAASNNGVDNIREIRDEVLYSPTEGRYKVYIIDEVHMLSIGAFNALLKTLEEPPSYVIFILATTEAHKIPITILSRCQRYDFHRISIDTIAGRLSQLMEAEKINVEDKAVRYVAKAADGSMRDALSLLDQCIAFYLGRDLKYENVLEVLGAVDTDVFSRALKIILSGDTSGCMELLEEIIMQGRDLAQFVNDFIWYLRNLLLIQSSDNQEKIADVIEVSAENMETLREDAGTIDVETLMRYIRVLSELSADLKFSTQKRIKIEVTLIKLMRPAMDRTADTATLVSRISVLEKQMQEALENIKNGVIPAGVYTARNMGTDEAVLQENEAAVLKPAERRIIDALPEDIAQIAAQWDTIIRSYDDPMQVNILMQANVTLSEDRKSLEIMLKSRSAYGVISREENIEKLVELIEERTGIRVNIICTMLEENDDFHSRYIDIRELINKEIEVDDKEEFI